MTIQIQQGDAVHLTESSTSHTDTVKSRLSPTKQSLTSIDSILLRDQKEPPITSQNSQEDLGYLVENFTTTVRGSIVKFD
jgi:hypothetical protein